MATDDKIRDEKLQFDINKEATKISATSSGKIDKYEEEIFGEILPPSRKRVIEQATFTYYPLGNALQKQAKAIEDHGVKQTKSLEKHGKQLVKSSGEKESLTL